MKTAVKITPAHEVVGLQLETLFDGSWSPTGAPLRLNPNNAELYRRQFASDMELSLRKVRLVPITIVVPEYPSQDYIEEMWLKGYQSARKGKPLDYGPGMNKTLIDEGFQAFIEGKKLFE